MLARAPSAQDAGQNHGGLSPTPCIVTNPSFCFCGGFLEAGGEFLVQGGESLVSSGVPPLAEADAWSLEGSRPLDPVAALGPDRVDHPILMKSSPRASPCPRSLCRVLSPVLASRVMPSRAASFRLMLSRVRTFLSLCHVISFGVLSLNPHVTSRVKQSRV